MDVVFGAPTVANSTRGLFAERESMFTERQSAFVARENTPMSDNLSKRRIHYAKNPNTMQIIGLRCVFCLAYCRISDIDVNLEAEIRNN
mgnify:CR=1 FL=1